MEKLFTLNPDQNGHIAVEEWLSGEPHELFAVARKWCGGIRACGDDVTLQLHDGCPTACVQEVAFAYVNVFKAHINVGFFRGAFLDDPQQLLEGTGKRMRHVKIYPGAAPDCAALSLLIENAYRDIKKRL